MRASRVSGCARPTLVTSPRVRLLLSLAFASPSLATRSLLASSLTLAAVNRTRPWLSCWHFAGRELADLSRWLSLRGRMRAEWVQSGVRWLLGGFSMGSVVVTLLVSEAACAGLGLDARQSKPMMAKHAMAMAAAQAGARVAGGRLLARGRVRMAIYEFRTPKEARKARRQCHQKMVLLGLTGWQTDTLVVCNGRALSFRGHSARDPATADAEECALAAGRGAASVSAAAVSE